VGTGIGAGIILDGKVLNGFTGTAGSIGWLALARPFRAQYANCGCFEYYASGDGLARTARQRKLRLNSGARELFAAYESGNRAARSVIADAIQFWGMAVANLASLFNPEKIIFGGGVFGPAVVFLDKIRAEAQKWGQPIAMKHVRLDGSSLGADAALYGGAYLALRRQPRTR
jgi:glucokinase